MADVEKAPAEEKKHAARGEGRLGPPLGPSRCGRALPDTVVSAKEFAGQVTIVVETAAIARVARHLKDAEDFKYCVDVTAVDWKTRAPRFDVVYSLLFVLEERRASASSAAPPTARRCPSIAAVFLAANWCERETWDMFGIPLLRATPTCAGS